MPFEITVGPPQLLVHIGETFWLSEPDGQCDLDARKGLFFRDTRLLSTWALFANGEGWDLLNGGAVEHFCARVFLTNRRIPTQEGDIAPRSLSLMLGRWVDGGVHEDIEIENHGRTTVRFNLELSLRSDFADIFEVKSGRLVRRGRITSTWNENTFTLRTAYENQDFLRALSVEARGDSEAGYANGRINFPVAIPPGARWHACLFYTLEDGAERFAPPARCIDDALASEAGQGLAAWRARAMRVQTPNPEMARTLAQAVDDLAALRLPVDGHTVVAAGLPWFLALFGRDSIITAMQALPVTPVFARGALAVLGARLADRMDPARDAEPGKVLHEERLGELAHFRLIPHTPYYGTADATALWLILLHRTWCWTGERALLEAHLPAAERCLAWIDAHGDRDGDGFQEYGARGARGYENMGWKDSADGVLHEDGSMVEGPKALCELQAYTYAAWRGMAEIHAALGNAARAAELAARAAALFNRFNEVFWDEALGCVLYALDGHKRPVRSVASNAGHCLWAGILRPDRARRVAQRLMAPDMFSGWGIRTLSAGHPAYNPYSYHNGSVWPHDNGLIAEGLARYGLHEDAARLARGLHDAADYFAMHQVPELFSGVARDGATFPVQCLGANVPQAWAAGSSFSLLQALVGFAPDPLSGRLRLRPRLPDWLPELTLRGLEFNGAILDLHIAGATARTLRGPDVIDVL